MSKKLNKQDFALEQKKIDGATLEVVSSCNLKNCVDENTRLIIVGTITPPEGAGYFYTSPYNKIYGYIDAALNTDLKAKKKILHETKDLSVINEIIDILKSKGIAFLDVFDSVIRKQKSPYDDDIKYYTLDIDSFKKNINAKFICNSRLAEKCFLEICETLGISDPNYIYLSQRKGTKDEWVQTIKER